MTHKDIYTKFMIEYDKANVTSSYPSLTEYEVATLLDKAYNALIAQKVTGNNPRRAPFEVDNKAIADIAPLIKHADLGLFKDGHEPAINISQYRLPEDFMYYVSSALNYRMTKKPTKGDLLLEPEVYAQESVDFEQQDDNDWVKHSDVYYNENYNGSSEDITENDPNQSYKQGLPYDGNFYRLVPMQITTHQIAERFFNTPYNMPWVKKPVTYAEGNSMFVVYDPIKKPMINSTAHLSYIKKPNKFIDSLVQQTITIPDIPDDKPDDPDNTKDNRFILDKSQLNSNDKIQ